MIERRAREQTRRVTCAECGQPMRGMPRRDGGFSIRKHQRPSGHQCRGHWRFDHQLDERAKS